MEKGKGILLESGTNELEIVEFSIGNAQFGINVIKVREIVELMPVFKIPNAHPCIEGIIKLRDSIMKVVDLARALNYDPSPRPESDKLIVAEFNQLKVAFRVHGVSRIHRISWEQIEQPSDIYQVDCNTTIGIVKMGDRIILLLDYEKIVAEISPQSAVLSDSLKVLSDRERSDKNIMVVDDSATLRSFLKQVLTEAGYTNLSYYNNGSVAWDYLVSLVQDKGEQLFEEIQLVITDIEMPKMDGHHLTKRIKEHPLLRKLPVVIFSSLITEDLLHKGYAVGVDAQISKPQYLDLIGTIDKLISSINNGQ
ncbi:response regulator receiver modulated CheW protein [Desulfofarcimen acetoxidans DSM 771]|uniref:Stage 0 sporulation protein A homolog n=1 Tax=Desulfofarcimen acetoxidans (strain ATCC 49208 / DSM 771 / KCTC 5769 / VKM B-1644 / 5575) TaxID=485916 RepID=C8VVG3_DESAS|nr:chemotaxis protein [Desulfofarcimen acetoxidans]ACV61029.1 response regulator receiver modulated CheW protein [Desulfofarcimen acetoxidans DSM 771]